MKSILCLKYLRITVFAVLVTPFGVIADTPLQWNELVGIYSQNGQVRLDLGTRAMKESVPASHSSWATRLKIMRVDGGPNSGPVMPNHIIGIYSEDGRVRLDLGTRAMKEGVPASHDSWATRLRIAPIDQPNAQGNMTYGTLVGIYSEDGRVRLDLGTRAMKENVPASHDSWATRLFIGRLNLPQYTGCNNWNPNLGIYSIPNTTGRDVNTVTFTSLNGGNTPDGYFRQVGCTQWSELGAGRETRFNFDEVNRDDWSVYLVDRSRNVNIQLDLHRKRVVYSQGNGPRSDLYQIKHASHLDWSNYPRQ